MTLGVRMKTSSLVASACVLSLLAGCATAPPATAWTPTIDSKGTNQARYDKDLAECRGYATATPDANGAKAAKKEGIKSGIEAGAVMGVVTIASGGLALIPIMAGSLAAGTGVGAFYGAQGGKAATASKAAATRCWTDDSPARDISPRLASGCQLQPRAQE
jgi:hypothetical protein